MGCREASEGQQVAGKHSPTKELLADRCQQVNKEKHSCVNAGCLINTGDEGICIHINILSYRDNNTRVIRGIYTLVPLIQGIYRDFCRMLVGKQGGRE